MAEPGTMPRGALPLGPSVYEDAMYPIYMETMWRERNFYKADDGETKKETSPPPPPAPSPLAVVTNPVKDFGDFLRPNGQWSWPRVGVVVGGLLLIGYLVGKR